MRVTRRAKSPIWRRVILAGLIIVGLSIAAGGWLALDAYRTRGHLVQAARLVTALRGQLAVRGPNGQSLAAQGLAAQNLDRARAILTALRRHSAAARAGTEDPIWRLGTHLPGVGTNLAAIGTLTRNLDALATHALPPIVEIAGELDPSVLTPKNGRMNVAALTRAAPRIAEAASAIRSARAELGAVPTADLIPRLRSAFGELSTDLGRAERLISTAARAADLVPPMLGAEGPRRYLVLFQNLAEARATGGMLGAYAVVRTDHGAITVTEVGSAGPKIGLSGSPTLTLDPDLRQLYTDRPGTYISDVNLSPHFPTAAALARAMYRRTTGTAVDGVIVTDPVALSYLLRATGPVAVPDGPTLTAADAVRQLQSDVYLRLDDAAEQDRYFAAAAVAVFDVLRQGRADPTAAMSALTRAAGERRLLLWSARRSEQRLIAGTVLEGALPDNDGDRPTVGVFLNDGTGSKLSYYLTNSVDLRVGQCRPDGRRELRLRVTLRSSAPATGLPRSVTGMALGGRPGTTRTNVMVYAPTGGGLGSVRLDGVPVSIGTGVERRRNVGVLTVDLKPGASRTVDLVVLTDAAGAAGVVAPRLWTTPGVRTWSVSVTPGAACAEG